MRIAILGTRGIPANYGGFETFAEELGARLAQRGHEVTVYGRSHYVPSGVTGHRGVGIVVLPTVRHKYLDTIVHTGLSTLHTLTRRYDVVLMCNAANAVFAGWPRLVGTRVALNVDGLERQRRKWNALGRAWYLVSERLATWFPNAIVTDARVIRRYYRDRYGADSTFIPYGADLTRLTTTTTLDRFGLEPGRYFLYVSRLEPENNAHAVIEAFTLAGLDRKLAVVGDAPYARSYIDGLRRLAGPGVVFTGGVYGEGYRELQSQALAYVHATEVGGTHPALVEAMGFGNCVLVNDVPENREAAGDAARYFRASAPETLAALMREVSSNEPERQRLRALARARAGALYSWDAITEQYERLFESMVGAARARHAPTEVRDRR
jgi:glycosyltransferase involved in cell wall biosynthesis